MSEVQGWTAIAVAALVLPSALYAWRHLTHDRRPRDVTAAPPDLTWKSDRALRISLLVLAAAGFAAAFILSPYFNATLRAAWFAPALLGVLGSFCLGSVIRGLRDGGSSRC